MDATERAIHYFLNYQIAPLKWEITIQCHMEYTGRVKNLRRITYKGNGIELGKGTYISNGDTIVTGELVKQDIKSILKKSKHNLHKKTKSKVVNFFGYRIVLNKEYKYLSVSNDGVINAHAEKPTHLNCYGNYKGLRYWGNSNEVNDIRVSKLNAEFNDWDKIIFEITKTNTVKEIDIDISKLKK
jgi:hypothetical protein